MSVISPQKNVFNLMLQRSRTGQRKFVGTFSGDREKAPFDGYWAIANGAVSSAEQFFADGESIDNDGRLSAAGKLEKKQELSRKSIDVIKNAARRLAQVRTMVRGQETQLVAFDPYTNDYLGLIQAHIDLANASVYRQSTGAERETLSRQISTGTNPTLAAAIHRLPQTISGASPNLIAQAAQQALEKRFPAELEQRQQIEDAERVSQNAVNESLREVANAAQIRPAELRALLGEDSQHFDPRLLSRERYEAHETRAPVNDGDVKPEEPPADDAAAA